MSLSLGIIRGGIDLSTRELCQALSAILKLVADNRVRSSISSLPELNVVFYVPGDISRPDFDGIRFGRFSVKRKILLAQIAVTDAVIANERPSQFIFGSIDRAIKLAGPKFRRHKLQFDVTEHLEFTAYVRGLYLAEEESE